jgi:rubrerythrin
MDYGKLKNKMLSKIPFDLDKIKKEDLDKELLRAGIIAELDAINLYEQIASLTEDENLKKIFLDVAKEEKTHVGEFQTLLLERDREQEQELEEGRKEVEEELKD